MSRITILLVLTVMFAPRPAQAGMEFVRVGNPGNPGEWSAFPYHPGRFCGGVDYVYWMGKYEVTLGQYTEFLNAVAAEDRYGLYNDLMGWAAGPQIVRSGESGSYRYHVTDDWTKHR